MPHRTSYPDKYSAQSGTTRMTAIFLNHHTRIIRTASKMLPCTSECKRKPVTGALEDKQVLTIPMGY